MKVILDHLPLIVLALVLGIGLFVVNRKASDSAQKVDLLAAEISRAHAAAAAAAASAQKTMPPQLPARKEPPAEETDDEDEDEE